MFCFINKLSIAVLFITFSSVNIVNAQKNENNKALARVEKGYVILEFDINRFGNTENIKVSKSHPEGHFDKFAIETLAKWKYKPEMKNGIPMGKIGQKVQLEFLIE